jgi:hypothetical protein
VAIPNVLPLRSCGVFTDGEAHISYAKVFVTPIMITVSAPFAAADIMSAELVKPTGAEPETIA